VLDGSKFLSVVRAIPSVVRATLSAVRATLSAVRATLSAVRATLSAVRATLSAVRATVSDLLKARFIKEIVEVGRKASETVLNCNTRGSCANRSEPGG
jgi:phage-related protein